MKLTFLGVRGSTPISGPAFLRYGGQTSCVAVTFGDEAAPTLLLDAGTGLQGLSALTDGHPFTGTILCTHLHWDHVQGLPFARPLDRADSQVRLVVPADDDAAAHAVVTGLMQPPYFPITPDELGGRWRIVATSPSASPAAVQERGPRITAIDVPHKGGRTVAYRIEADGVSVVYAPDHALAAAASAEVVQFVDGADVLVHDAQFITGEEAVSEAYGHSTIDQVLEFARLTSVRQVVLTHHSPGRTDDELDAIASSFDGSAIPVTVGHAGLVIETGIPAASI